MWLSTKEAAEMMGVSVRTVQRQISSGKLEAREVAGHGGNGKVWEVFVPGTGKKQPQKIKTIPENFSRIVLIILGYFLDLKWCIILSIFYCPHTPAGQSTPQTAGGSCIPQTFPSQQVDVVSGE